MLQRRYHTILVVDDSLATRELERSILETAGFKVDTARDGLEALKICRERRPDLVLTDVEMPNMDGFRLSLAIRQDDRLSDLPVIIVSSRDSDEDRRKGLDAGAQAYIVKGQFEQNKLLDTISLLLSK
jgi:PleD family two-component response regulator